MIFLTGATGLVGKHLLKLLLEKKLSVKVLIRKESDKNKFDFNTQNVEWVIGDLLDTYVLQREIQSVHTVFHCAAIVSYSKKRIDEMHKTNIEGTANIVNICLENNVEKLCHFSSIASLDPDIVTGAITEKTHLDESKEHSQYALSKYYAELEVWRGIEEGLNAIILNPTIILGPSEWNTSSTKIFKYVWNKNKYYIGGSYNFIDVRDVVQQAFTIATSDKANQQYILSGENLTYKELFEQIAIQFKIPPPSVKATKFQKMLVLWWSNFRSIFSSEEPIITKEAINKSDKNPIIDNSKINQDFPHTYYSINHTIAWTCQELMLKTN